MAASTNGVAEATEGGGDGGDDEAGVASEDEARADDDENAEAASLPEAVPSEEKTSAEEETATEAETNTEEETDYSVETWDEISLEPSIETVDNDGAVLLGFFRPMEPAVEEEGFLDRSMRNISLVVDGAAVHVSRSL